MKSQVGTVNALPSKRIFQSIISDYDLNRSICELIDNVLDIWTKNGRKGGAKIEIDIDTNQQTIRVADNAGGVKESELRLIVGPGQTSNEPTDETIGLFGVGTKRAVVHLAESIRITTRHGNAGTYRVEIDDDWLKNEDWNLPYYKVDDVTQGTTIIELTKLRAKISDELTTKLKEHLQATYSIFLKNKNVVIALNSEPLEPIDFDDFAFPPRYPPHKHTGYIPADDGKKVKVEVVAGLTAQSNPESGEYGVYLYCNRRLIGRALKSYPVGFTRGLAGLPHFNVSLVPLPQRSCDF